MGTSMYRADTVVHLLSRGELNPATGCLEWTGGLCTSGYAQAEVAGKTVRVHRYLALALLVHDDTLREKVEASRLEACHTCDNRKCINPQHLFWGTHSMNMQDCISKGKMPKYRPHKSTSKTETGLTKWEKARLWQIWPDNLPLPDWL